MAEDDDDLYDEDLEDDETEDEQEATEAAAEEAPKPAKKTKPAPAAAESDEQAQLAQLGLNALKQSFVESAKAEGYVAADFDGIGLKGIDEAGKAAFLAEAKASHEAKVEALAAQGFVYNPEAAGTAAQAQQIEAQEAALQAAWGKPGPGLAATGGEKFQQQVEDEVKRGDMMGVIGSLVSGGGLGEFFVRGRRGK